MESIEYIKYALIVLPAVILLCALILFMSHGQENILRRIRNGTRTLKRWIALVLILAVAYGGVYFKTEQMQAEMQASVIIGFNYPEASSGLTPNKTRFNVSEVLSDEILEQAISEGNLGNVSANELKRCLQVTPLKAGDSISPDQVYISTEYQLTYEANKDTQHLEPEDVVTAIAQVYCRKFVEDNSRKTNVFTMDFSELESMDYLDIVSLLDSRAENISDYAYAMSGESATFQSDTTGETFASISEKVQAFRDVQLESFQAFILSNGLAKNADQYVAKLKYDNTTTHKTYLRNLATHNINLDAIRRYDRDMATIVLIPSVDLEGTFYMSRTRIGVDYFAEDAEEAMQNAAKRQRSIQFNDYAIAQMQNAAQTSAQVAKAEEMLESLKEEYQVFSQLLVDTLTDYDRKTVNNYVSMMVAEGDSLKREVVKTVLFAGVFAVALSALIIALNGRRESVSSIVAAEAEGKKKQRSGKRAKAEKGNGNGNENGNGDSGQTEKDDKNGAPAENESSSNGETAGEVRQ